jgi:hypothetical protein
MVLGIAVKISFKGEYSLLNYFRRKYCIFCFLSWVTLTHKGIFYIYSLRRGLIHSNKWKLFSLFLEIYN